MDKVISKIAALGIPGLALLIAINASGFAGAAAITTALAAIGPGGMVGGIITLGTSIVIIESISKFGFDALYSGVIKELYKRGETKKSIREKINKYPVSKDLKRKLLETVDKL